MLCLKKVLATMVVALLTSGGVGKLSGIEIDFIEGRPWDSGRAEINTGANEGPTYRKEANAYWSEEDGGFELFEGEWLYLKEVSIEIMPTLENR